VWKVGLLHHLPSHDGVFNVTHKRHLNPYFPCTTNGWVLAHPIMEIAKQLKIFQRLLQGQPPPPRKVVAHHYSNVVACHQSSRSLTLNLLYPCKDAYIPLCSLSAVFFSTSAIPYRGILLSLGLGTITSHLSPMSAPLTLLLHTLRETLKHLEGDPQLLFVYFLFMRQGIACCPKDWLS